MFTGQLEAKLAEIDDPSRTGPNIADKCRYNARPKRVHVLNTIVPGVDGVPLVRGDCGVVFGVPELRAAQALSQDLKTGKLQLVYHRMLGLLPANACRRRDGRVLLLEDGATVGLSIMDPMWW